MIEEPGCGEREGRACLKKDTSSSGTVRGCKEKGERGKYPGYTEPAD